MTAEAIADIETRRRTMNLPATRLCAAASVGRQTYREAVLGLKRPSPATLARLNHALNRFRIGFAGEAGAIAPHAAFKACILIAAFATDADARAALNARPSKRATSDPAWRAAARTRRIAFWIANQWLGFHQSDVARAAGCTKAAVSAALRELEDERDHDRDLDRLFNRIEEIFA
jgi:transcriptional regulator with XRE-family HTH domain